MLQRRKEIGIVGISTLFILANAYLTVGNEFLLNGLPILLFAFIFLLFSVKQLFFTLALLAPLSVPLYRLIPGLAFDFWFGKDFSLWEEEKVQEALGLIYRTKENGFYNIALGTNSPFSIYIAAFEPKEVLNLQTTRLVLFGDSISI